MSRPLGRRRSSTSCGDIEPRSGSRHEGTCVGRRQRYALAPAHPYDSQPEAREHFERYRKLRRDPRVTKVGAILRKLSLDELPQLFNILKGDMSLIGPRPIMDDEMTKYYSDHVDWYYSVKPGITGFWQVSGKNDVDYEERVAMEVWYIRNWSFWLDAIIAIRTVRVIVQEEGAY